MGMFDHYQPEPPLRCSHCQSLVRGWQGKDSECDLLLWVQGCASPVDQLVDDQWKGETNTHALARLPDRFEIYTTCEQCGRWIGATGFTFDGVWSETVYGHHWASKAIPAALIEHGWRQCSRCGNAREDASRNAFSECPSCKSLTRLDESSFESLRRTVN